MPTTIEPFLDELNGIWNEWAPNGCRRRQCNCFYFIKLINCLSADVDFIQNSTYINCSSEKLYSVVLDDSSTTCITRLFSTCLCIRRLAGRSIPLRSVLIEEKVCRAYKWNVAKSKINSSDGSLLFWTETVSAASVDERYSFNYKSIRGQQTMAVAHVKIDRLQHVHDHRLGAMHVIHRLDLSTIKSY